MLELRRLSQNVSPQEISVEVDKTHSPCLCSRALDRDLCCTLVASSAAVLRWLSEVSSNGPCCLSSVWLLSPLSEDHSQAFCICKSVNCVSSCAVSY